MKRWYSIAFLNFILAGIAGVVLRSAFVFELPIDYFHLRHAHSHMAMLGWIYLALLALINHAFLPSSASDSSRYQRLFWAIEVSALGMFISFLLQGYGWASIAFFILHILLSYGYILWIWKDTRFRSGKAIILLRSALIWLFLSTLAVWVIGVLVPLDMNHSIWYHMSTQFFLHFQLGGWFTFAVLALFFKQLEDKEVHIPTRQFRWFFWLMILATLLTYALAIAWASSHPASYIINGLGVFLQLAALLVILHLLYHNVRQLKPSYSSTTRLLYGLVLLVFIVKILMQSALIFPEVAKMAHTIQNLVIGFIHLTVLGFVTFFLIGSGLHQQFLKETTISKTGVYIFISGVLITEIMLFLQGLFFWLEIGFLPYYYHTLFVTSLLLPIGLLLILPSIKNPISSEND